MGVSIPDPTEMSKSPSKDYRRQVFVILFRALTSESCGQLARIVLSSAGSCLPYDSSTYSCHQICPLSPRCPHCPRGKFRRWGPTSPTSSPFDCRERLPTVSVRDSRHNSIKNAGIKSKDFWGEATFYQNCCCCWIPLEIWRFQYSDFQELILWIPHLFYSLSLPLTNSWLRNRKILFFHSLSLQPRSEETPGCRVHTVPTT